MPIESMGPITVTVASGQTSKSETIKRNGRLRTCIFETPDTGAATSTLEILDSNQYIIHKEADVAASTKKGENATDLGKELYGTMTLKVTISAAPGSDMNFKVELVYEV